MDEQDPYVAYCIDEACAYVADKMERGIPPRLPKVQDAQSGKVWSTNAELVEELLRTNRVI